MELEGKKLINADRETVWNALVDPNRLQASIPGCNYMERINEDTYKYEIKIKVAAIVGEYTGEISLIDIQPLNSYGLDISGEGAIGHMKAKVYIELNEQAADQTEMVYKGEADVGGKVAKVGQRVLSSVSNLIIKQFFNSFVKQI